ncbi:DUF4397 domain-containing protein [Natronomonas salina]|uniref:DUF4397 domain-containing protein n=1 Tax=Natronomonas salina TaxID=1710540 RepID=UPI0015B656F2|nr:DUF4397 domain-containing protein [Natronomonas salina]QLD88679.1 DUF4397 domain-containing protein [Natronomonas salina]
MVSDRVTRRTFVGSLTAAGGIGLAGCGGLGGNGNGGNGNGGNGNGGNGNGDGGSPTDGGESDGGETSPTEEGTEEPVDENALQVRAVHALVGAPDVDVYVDDEPAFEGVSYTDVTSYEPIDSGTAQVRVTAAGDDRALFENELDVEDGGSYSVVAFGEYGSGTSAEDSTPTENTQTNATATQENDTGSGGGEPATPAGGSSAGGLQVVSLDDEVASGEDTQVRAFHASPDADAVDVSLADADEPLVTDLAYGELSDYGAVEAGVQTVEVRAAGEDEALTDVDADFQEGRAHTAYAMGYAGAADSSDEALQLVAAVDGTEEGSGGASSGGTGNETAGNESSMDDDWTNESSMGDETETSSA